MSNSHEIVLPKPLERLLLEDHDLHMSVAKDQHFLPQFYLRQFVDPDTPPGMEPYVWLYDLAEGRWRKRAPKNVASLRHYYAFRGADNQLINVLDPKLATVESLGAILIRKLVARKPLTEHQQLHFSLFVALLTVRTPQSRELTKSFFRRKGREFIAAMIQRWRDDPEEYAASQRTYQEKTGKEFAMGVDELEKHTPELVLNDAGVLGFSMLPALGLMQQLLEMTWRFYSTEQEDRLIICDHPCDFALPHAVTEESFHGFMTKDAEFHVPLTPNLVFTAHDDGFGRAFDGPLGREDVARINRRMAHRAEQFIVSTKPTFVGDDVLVPRRAN